MTKFQIILLIVFGFLIIVAVATFSLAGRNSGSLATVVIWGETPQHEFDSSLNKMRLSDSRGPMIEYIEKRRDTIELELTEALATGRGPDLVILSQEKIWKNRAKLLPIPYSSLSARDFQNTFAEEGELFLREEGIYALPLYIDPLVLYYNRDHLTSAGVARVIAYWDELSSASALLTIKDPAGNIRRSAIALGESKNIPHYKEILSVLMLQSGTSITGFNGGELRSTLSLKLNSITPAESSLDFYRQFADPAKNYHTWSRSLLPAQTNFASGDSVYYLGFASELSEIRAKNPTLNLGISLIPQSRTSERVITYGRMYSLAIVKNPRDFKSAFGVAIKIVSKNNIQWLSEASFLPPARRDLLSERQNDSYQAVFYQSALQSRGWHDPDHSATAIIFREMIDSVTSGRARTGEAVSRASREIDAIIKNSR
jgi:ABC-type glycerol-3-phosphate transport system substrate-binding protein